MARLEAKPNFTPPHLEDVMPRRKSRREEEALAKTVRDRSRALKKLPEHLQKIFETDLEGTRSSDFDTWRRKVYAEITEAAETTLDMRFSLRGNERADCPLCGRGAADRSLDTVGWRVPTGLMWHLEGKGRASKCEVMEVIESPLRFRVRQANFARSLGWED